MWDYAEQNILQRYIRKHKLLQCSWLWMKESEKFAYWSRLAAVMQMKWVDQAVMSGCLEDNL